MSGFREALFDAVPLPLKQAIGVGIGLFIAFIGFVAALFVTPLAAVVPHEAATPALVVVGFLLMSQVRDIPWDDYDVALPAFLTIVLMPFTFSITNGIGAGFVSFVALELFRGRIREVHWMMTLVALAFVAYFAIEPVEHLLGVSG